MRFNAFAATVALIFYRRRVHVMGRRPRANERRQFACAKRLGFGTSARLRSRSLLRYVPKPCGEIEILCPHSTAPKDHTCLIISEKPESP